MRDNRTQQSAAAWHVPVAVEDVGETGDHFDLVADAEIRAAIARIAGLRDLPRLEAQFDVVRRGADSLQVTGHVSATVGQNCVVTLEPISNEVAEDVDLLFVPPAAIAADGVEEKDEATAGVGRETKWDEPEALIGGMVDLGALATEFLLLGLDPYPRKDGAVFEPLPDRGAGESPFAALAGLAKGRK